MASNALYQPPTVDNAVYEMFGMQPGMDRLNLLPRHDKKQGWIAPNALYQLARAIAAPGVAARGGDVSPEDAVNFATNVSLGSYGVSRALPNAAPGPGKTLPMTVYHGSPHSFDAFDISKIGTGEGAQAYGHGLYVAESPTVAKTYTTAGKPLNPNDMRNWLVNDRPFRNTINDNAAVLVAQKGRDGALESLRYMLGQSEKYSGKGSSEYKAALQKQIYAIESGSVGVARQNKGTLYHVDLPDEHIARMLDWDAPLSQQPESVRKALRNAGIIDNEDYPTFPVPSHLKDDGEVAALIRGLAGQSSGDRFPALSKIDARTADEAASKFLASLGIPGIKYFDGGSRAAGNGTRNYVVFDDKLLKILKKE